MSPSCVVAQSRQSHVSPALCQPSETRGPRVRDEGCCYPPGHGRPAEPRPAWSSLGLSRPPGSERTRSDHAGSPSLRMSLGEEPGVAGTPMEPTLCRPRAPLTPAVELGLPWGQTGRRLATVSATDTGVRDSSACSSATPTGRRGLQPPGDQETSATPPIV